MAPYNLVDDKNNSDEYVGSIFIIKYLKIGAIFTSKDLDSTCPNKATEGCLNLKYRNMYILTLKASQTLKSVEILGLVFEYYHESFFHFVVFSTVHHRADSAESALIRDTVQPFTEFQSEDTRCCGNTICPPEDGHVDARNMSRIVM